MMLLIKDVWKCMFSPRLYKIYNDGPLDAMYKPLDMERWCDKIIYSANIIYNITVYTSPLILLYFYKRGLYTLEELKVMGPVFEGLAAILVSSFLLRAYGRASNPQYMSFMRALDRKPDQTFNTYISAVRRYDFDFASWPVSFEIESKARSSYLPNNPFVTTANSDLPFYQQSAIQLLAFLAMHTFALRLIYPGSLGLINNLLWTPLFQGRGNLVETYNGQRSKLKTADNNDIDTMFVDNRLSNPNGNILVVCCEGNSGFYEVGIVFTPVKTGYSTLGWNHPGFAGSTGLPYPPQEHNAIDAVMQYAINKLNFKPENIVMLGWSIGGYSAAWAAANYPVKGVVLDATFDDLLPLARKQMPESWSLLVKEVVRSYVDLHISEVLKCYNGPVHLVRRTDDEIISLTPGNHSTNRANQLLVDIIKHRHPEVAEQHLELVVRYSNMLAVRRPAALHKATGDEQTVLQYVEKYMSDLHSTHCTPLPDSEFRAVMHKLLR